MNTSFSLRTLAIAALLALSAIAQAGEATRPKVGLVLGGVGSLLFVQSMPPAEGSPEQQVARMEVELKAARNRITALEAADPRGRLRSGLKSYIIQAGKGRVGLKLMDKRRGEV